MNTGTVKFFNVAKGFGFVTPDDGSADLFLPAAAVISAGMNAIKAGQRIAFAQAPDAKGPKVASLKLVGDASTKVPGQAAERVTVYCDANADLAADVLGAVQSSGFLQTTLDYVTAPPGIDELKRLSQMLSASGQSLVRRYDPLFLALRLDDRFITDQDFWTAIVEHPILINGPVLMTSARARVCKTADDVRAFLREDSAATSAKSKTLSPRIAAMLMGEVLPDTEPATLARSASLPPAPVRPPEIKARSVARAAAKSKSTLEPKADARRLAKASKKVAPARRAAKPTSKANKSTKKAKKRAKR